MIKKVSLKKIILKINFEFPRKSICVKNFFKFVQKLLCANS